MTPSSRTGRDAGFTLIEVVIAMTLLAILMLALSGSIGFVGRTWDKAWDRSTEMGRLVRIDEVTRRTIENAFPAVIREGTKERFLFSGNTQNLRLVTYEGAGGMAPGYHTVEIGIGADGRTLVYRRRPFQPGNAPGGSSPIGTSDDAMLLQGDFSFAFSYFGAPRPKMAPAWYDGWDYRDRLPDLVRLQIIENGKEAWPPIIAQAAINAEYACLAGDGLCRSREPTP